jgi:hypothetical protein
MHVPSLFLQSHYYFKHRTNCGPCVYGRTQMFCLSYLSVSETSFISHLSFSRRFLNTKHIQFNFIRTSDFHFYIYQNEGLNIIKMKLYFGLFDFIRLHSNKNQVTFDCVRSTYPFSSFRFSGLFVVVIEDRGLVLCAFTLCLTRFSSLTTEKFCWLIKKTEIKGLNKIFAIFFIYNNNHKKKNSRKFSSK